MGRRPRGSLQEDTMQSTFSKGAWQRPPDTPDTPRRARDDLESLYVRIEQFASVLQEKYGLSRAEAMRKIAALKRAFNEEA